MFSFYQPKERCEIFVAYNKYSLKKKNKRFYSVHKTKFRVILNYNMKYGTAFAMRQDRKKDTREKESID